MGNARCACLGGTESFAQSDSVLGQRYRRVLSDARIDRRVIYALVSVLDLLRGVPIAWPHLAPALAVGMEHGRIRHHRTRSRGTARIPRRHHASTAAPGSFGAA